MGCVSLRGIPAESHDRGDLRGPVRPGWARRFFEHWQVALKWQRLEPYEQFAAMIERHWEGIAAYCRPENKVALGFVEGLNNKIRVLQRRAYGLRDEEWSMTRSASLKVRGRRPVTPQHVRHVPQQDRNIWYCHPGADSRGRDT